MRLTLLVLAASAVALPAAGRAQMPRTAAPSADLRGVRLVTERARRAPATRDGWRPPSHRPPVGRPQVPGRVRPAVIVVGPFGAFAGAYLPYPAPAVPTMEEPAAPRVPRTRVIEVGEAAPADTACGWATHARALMDCMAAALRGEDERLAAATARAREPLRRTRPAATLSAFDSAAAAWSRYRERECRARALAVGGEATSLPGLECQRRLARERRALLEGALGSVSGAAPAPAR